MKGKIRVRVRNSKNNYIFDLERSITVLRGNSGSGKSTLFDMIRDYNRFKKSSGVSISCDREVIALSGDNWEKTIKDNPGTIIVIDEDSEFTKTKEFAKVINGCDNYFLLITRNMLPNLPFSVDEIYELEGGKNKGFKHFYGYVDRMYNRPSERMLPFHPEIIVTEDSKSGHDFFKCVSAKCGIECVSAKGKSNVLGELKKHLNKNVLVIADGAAFGPEMEKVVLQQVLSPFKIGIFLPESFEWLILKSGIIEGIDSDKLNHTETYADSTDYISWERYYTDLLIEYTKNNNYQKYTKSKLPDFYLQDKNVDRVCKTISGVKFEH